MMPADKCFELTLNNSDIPEDVRQHLYQNCPVAGCECDSRKGQWYRGCQCPCHYHRMDERYGRDCWSAELFELEANSQDEVLIRSKPPYTYSLGPAQHFAWLAQLAKEHRVWRKVANLCVWLHRATDFPFFIIPSLKGCGYRTMEVREKFKQALEDTKVPDVIRLELTRLFAVMTEERVRDAYGFDRVVFLPDPKQSIPVAVSEDASIPLIGRPYKIKTIIREQDRCFLTFEDLPGEWAADLFRGNINHPALLPRTIYSRAQATPDDTEHGN